MQQTTCAKCGSSLDASDLFCGDCGTPAPGNGRQAGEPAASRQPPAPWPGIPAQREEQAATGDTLVREDESWPSAGDAGGPFFEHEAPRPAGPLSNATRYLCAAAYLSRGFADLVIYHLVASRRAVAPSLNFDVGPVIRHCLRARRNLLIRDLLLMVVVLIALYLDPPPTLDFVFIAIVLAMVLHQAGGSRHGARGKLLFAGAITLAIAVVVIVSAVLAFSALDTAFHSGSSWLAALRQEAKVPVIFAILLAITGGIQFGFIRSTYRTLIEHLRLGAPPPRPSSSRAERRIAVVEGAQWGNVTLYDHDDPFIGAGFPQQGLDWSIAIKLESADPARQGLRPRATRDGEVAIDPVELHAKIRASLLRLKDPLLPVNERIAGLTVSDRLVGAGLQRWTSPVVDDRLRMPYSHASQEAVEALIRHPQAGLRYYQHVAVSDFGPEVTASGRTVLDPVDQGLAVSAFVYAAVEGRMFYLRFVMTALPPIAESFRQIDVWESPSAPGFLRRTLLVTAATVFSAVVLSPAGIWRAFRLWLHERREENASVVPDGSVAVELGAEVSVRELALSGKRVGHIGRMDVTKYQKIIQRMLLETVQDFLASHGVDTSAFAGSASVINNGIINTGSVSGDQNFNSGPGNITTRQAASASAE
jgi:hypothetical protein